MPYSPAAQQPSSPAAQQPSSPAAQHILTSLQLNNCLKKRVFSFFKSFKFAPILATAAVLSACGGGGDAAPFVNLFTLDRTITLKDGNSHSYDLSEKGIYAAEITSDKNGVTVQWSAANEAECTAASAEAKVYSKTCTLTKAGQITITNPAGQAGDEVVTVKIRQR